MITFNTPTPIEKLNFKNIPFLLKRDDKISTDFSGNKARKILWYLDNLPTNIDTIISYGSVQSNAMYSLAKFANLKGLKFRYYANHIPEYLQENPQGNFLNALNLGMELIEGYENIEIKESEYFIKEGIATKEAYYGIKELAIELKEQLEDKEYQIFLPSGTGTTALFLSKALQELEANSIKVFTTPCVGSSDYLLEQFSKLEPNTNFYPKVIDTKKRYHFGKLYREFYQIWLELHKETGVEFELLYDTKAWITILENKKLFTNLVYIHQGGVLGNSSMLARYKRKYGESV